MPRDLTYAGTSGGAISDTPPKTITLQEAYQLFRDWFDRDTLAMPWPDLPELDFEKLTPDEWELERAARIAGKPPRIPEILNEDERAPALAWWAEVKERDLKAASAFLRHLKTGDPEFIARDPITNEDIRVTPADWPDMPTFGDLLSPFDGPFISEPLGSSLARYNGLTLHTDRDEFAEWLEKQKPTRRKPEDTPIRGHSHTVRLRAWYRDFVSSWDDPRRTPNEKDMVKAAREALGPKVSRDEIRTLRKSPSTPRTWTRGGRRAEI